MNPSRLVSSLILLVSSSVAAYAGDWPQWRGPARNGVAPASPALVDEFPKDGPRKVWESAEIPGGNRGGWGSVAVSGGRAYVYVNQNVPLAWRMITKAALGAQGYAPEMPADLSKKVEEARAGEVRKALKDAKAVDAWIDQWMKTNTTEEQAMFGEAVRARLNKGPAAVRLEILDKLAPVIDRKFDTLDDWTKWLKESGLDEAAQKTALPLALPPTKDPHDYLYCLDAATGKTIWQTPFSADWFSFAASSTPTVVDGKVFVLGSEGAICCFDAVEGKMLWQSPVIAKKGNHHARASSVLVAEGLAVATAEPGATAVALADQKVVWTVNTLTSEYSSGATWSAGGKMFFLTTGGGYVALIDPLDATKIIKAKGGGYSTPAVVGDFAVTASNEGLSAYKLGADKIDRLWSVPYAKEEFASALIDDTYVYALGGGFSDKKEHNGKAVCVELQTGKVLWEESLPMAQLSSPLLADKKVFAVVGSELVVFKASPEKFQLVGRADLHLDKYCSPAIADGKLYLRTAKNIVCYDLTKAPESPAK